jgi:micrococcal nuclease
LFFPSHFKFLILKRTLASAAHYLLILLFLFGSLSCKEEIFFGKAVKISDGDTFTILTSEKKQIKIRLYGIDAPEKGQDFGNVAKEYLGQLLKDQVVTIRSKGRDQYGRTIGIATIGSKNVNEELLKAGLVWHFKEYDKNPDWNLLEVKAREQRKGLWSHTTPIPPWDFRKSRKQKKQ